MTSVEWEVHNAFVFEISCSFLSGRREGNLKNFLMWLILWEGKMAMGQSICPIHCLMSLCAFIGLCTVCVYICNELRSLIQGCSYTRRHASCRYVWSVERRLSSFRGQVVSLSLVALTVFCGTRCSYFRYKYSTVCRIGKWQHWISPVSNKTKTWTKKEKNIQLWRSRSNSTFKLS